jgi:glycosyltransferase involved in cell wall biosynthesis
MRMVTHHPGTNTIPLASIIIVVYNDWVPLARCLGSLAEQIDPPGFEVIIVDDGSKESAPEFVRSWSRFYPLTVVREPHAGIPSARNRGVRTSRGSIIVFVDADCRLRDNFIQPS